jgi:hypothetical protein
MKRRNMYDWWRLHGVKAVWHSNKHVLSKPHGMQGLGYFLFLHNTWTAQGYSRSKCVINHNAQCSRVVFHTAGFCRAEILAAHVACNRHEQTNAINSHSWLLTYYFGLPLKRSLIASHYFSSQVYTTTHTLCTANLKTNECDVACSIPSGSWI